MGLWMSRLLSLFGDREARILVLGLDNAGKTTILCECGEGERQTRAHAHFGLDTHPLFFSLTPLTYAQNSHTHTQTASRSARVSARSPVSVARMRAGVRE